MRLVFMGTPSFAVPSLQRLLDDGHELAGVFTQPDKPSGRGYKLTPSPVKLLALQHDIAVFQPSSLKNDEALSLIKDLAPQLIVVVAYGKILPENILEVPEYGCVNVHGSLLPKYRGAAPIQWSVLNGERETGVSTMFMAQGLDTGDIILSEKAAVGEDETAGELYDRLSFVGAQCLAKTMALFASGKAVPHTPQNDAEASLAPMLNKEMAKINFDKTAAELHNLIRGLSPWPVAYTTYNGKRLKVHRACVAGGIQGGSAREILDEKRMIIACGTGALELLEVQEEGARRVSGAEFMNGHHIKKGECLNNGL
ncbi:MAG: methionyl-tRNA formyltransferase [Hydrogenoanaerobacterium sp.]